MGCDSQSPLISTLCFLPGEPHHHSFAFIGFDIVATTAEETKQPQRDIPRGILASLGIVTVLYVAVAIVLSGMVSYTQLRDAETQNLATAFALNGVDWAAKVISIGALAGLSESKRGALY